MPRSLSHETLKVRNGYVDLLNAAYDSRDLARVTQITKVIRGLDTVLQSIDKIPATIEAQSTWSGS